MEQESETLVELQVTVEAEVTLAKLQVAVEQEEVTLVELQVVEQ